jgi:hypothetical protein
MYKLNGLCPLQSAKQSADADHVFQTVQQRDMDSSEDSMQNDILRKFSPKGNLPSRHMKPITTFGQFMNKAERRQAVSMRSMVRQIIGRMEKKNAAKLSRRNLCHDQFF